MLNVFLDKKTPRGAGRLLKCWIRLDWGGIRPAFFEHFVCVGASFNGPEQLKLSIEASLDARPYGFGNGENLFGADFDETIEGLEVAAVLGIKNCGKTSTGDQRLAVARCFDSH